jgi:hypothetical protein
MERGLYRALVDDIESFFLFIRHILTQPPQTRIMLFKEKVLAPLARDSPQAAAAAGGPHALARVVRGDIGALYDGVLQAVHLLHAVVWVPAHKPHPQPRQSQNIRE